MTGWSLIMQVFDSPDKCRNITGELGIAAASCKGQWKRQIKDCHRYWVGSISKPACEYLLCSGNKLLLRQGCMCYWANPDIRFFNQ